MIEQFSLHGKTAIVTGGTGALGGAASRALAAAGANVAVLARTGAKAKAVAAAAGSSAIGLACDVLDGAAVEAAAQAVETRFGRIDILINAAGGNRPEAITLPDQRSLFELPEEALRWVIDLNLLGAIIPAQIVGRRMAAQGSGVIINYSSMAAFRPLTRVVAYAAAKAAINNFTQWLAIYMAREYSPNIRVNAVAPGFFLSDQNRALLINPDGSLTERGRQIIDHTPLGRFGEPEELNSTLIWLACDASRFVTGIVVPVDGGFSAYSGV